MQLPTATLEKETPVPTQPSEPRKMVPETLVQSSDEFTKANPVPTEGMEKDEQTPSTIVAKSTRADEFEQFVVPSKTEKAMVSKGLSVEV